MFAYSGSGPYCYTHSLGMVLGSEAPAPGVIETLTGAPFGVQLLAGTVPLFDPLGWDPELGVDAALGLLGWTCVREAGGTEKEAVGRLRKAVAGGPVMVGPVDMGLLLYQPGTPFGSGDDIADHYVVVVDVGAETVVMHDPHGHPFATLPVAEFAAAWRAEAVEYIDRPYVMRHSFVRERVVPEPDALRAAMPQAVAWLGNSGESRATAGSIGGAAAVEALADQVRRGLAPQVRTLLRVFGVRVGARRLADAAACLARLDLADAAAVAARQARIVGALQYPLVTGDDRALEAGLRLLAPTYENLRIEIARSRAQSLRPSADCAPAPAVDGG
ncbi:hypothetical protein [Streptodolium elevatio]|uniref:Uncharacterized protein n=1 Tax=Streptodolium elevatio TaxID=3157996 RepID=A0ABV3DCL5_9ACTN